MNELNSSRCFSFSLTLFCFYDYYNVNDDDYGSRLEPINTYNE